MEGSGGGLPMERLRGACARGRGLDSTLAKAVVTAGALLRNFTPWKMPPAVDLWKFPDSLEFGADEIRLAMTAVVQAEAQRFVVLRWRAQACADAFAKVGGTLDILC